MNRMAHCLHCVGSPFLTAVSPGAADYPYSTFIDYANEGDRTIAIAGERTYFYLQAKDSSGNNKLTNGDAQGDVQSPEEQFTIDIIRSHGSVSGNVVYRISTAVLEKPSWAGDTGIVYLQANMMPLEIIACLEEMKSVLNSETLSILIFNIEATWSIMVTGPMFFRIPYLLLLDPQRDSSFHSWAEFHPGEYEDEQEWTGLSNAVVGIENGFVIESRDKFGNLRSSSSTSNIAKSGDGKFRRIPCYTHKSQWFGDRDVICGGNHNKLRWQRSWLCKSSVDYRGRPTLSAKSSFWGQISHSIYSLGKGNLRAQRIFLGTTLLSGSSYTVEVTNGSPLASSSFAYGSGLQTGVAGKQSSFEVQVRHSRQSEVQSIWASGVVSYGNTFQLIFRGQERTNIEVGVSTLQHLENSLVALPSIADIIVTLNGALVIETGDIADIEFL
eukprot:scaffold7486_cov54-Cyclotella_meneghiniana.AAC.1